MERPKDRKIGVLYNEIDNPEIAEQGQRKKMLAAISAGIAGIATAVIPKNAKADESYGVGVELGPDVNWIQGEGCPTNWMISNGGGQLMPGYKPDRFKLTFVGAYYSDECNNPKSAILAKEFAVADAPDGGIIVKGLGKTLPLDPALINQGIVSCIEVDRGDGRTAKIKQYGNDKIFKDGELKWDGDTIIDYGPDWGQSTTGLSAMHGSTKPNHVKLVKFGSFYVKAWENDPPPYASWGPIVDATADIDINAPNYYDAIQQSINDAWEKEGKDPYETGLLNHVEDNTYIAPETDTLLLVDGYGMGGGPAFIKHDPEIKQYTQLKRNADGTYVPENPQKGNADFPGPLPWVKNTMLPQALLKVQTPSGKQVHLIATQGEKINWAGGYFDLRLYSVEELAGITFKDINTTLEEQDQYPDDDVDGKVNHEDNCRWRANPDQVNSTADENGDACKADCTDGGWVGVDAVPLQTNSSGLRVCQSELGFGFAFSFEDGSTIHSNMDVEIANGKIALKPGQHIRFIHSWDPRTASLSASNISLPAGNSAKIKVNSAKNLDGSSGQTIFTHDGTPEYFNGVMDWQDFGIINSGEIEGASDIEIEVGNENPAPVVETQVEQTQQAEPVQTAETPQTVEIPIQAEPPPSQVELSIVAEQPSIVEISVAVEPMPDVVDSGVIIPPPPTDISVAEETGQVVIPPVEPQAEPAQTEPTSDVIQSYDTAQDTAQNPDTPTAGTDTQPDSPLTETPLSQDSEKDIAELNQDSPPANTDQSTGTDTPVQGKDMQSGTPDTSQGADIPKDTAGKPIPEEKTNGGGDDGGCSMAFVLDKKNENLPYQNTNVDGAGLLITASVLTRLYSWTRRKIAKV